LSFINQKKYTMKKGNTTAKNSAPASAKNAKNSASAPASAENALKFMQSTFAEVQGGPLRYYSASAEKNDKRKTLVTQLYFFLSPVSSDAPNLSAQRVAWLLAKIEAEQEISPALLKKATKVRSAPAAAAFDFNAQLSALKVEQLDELGQALREACPVLDYEVSMFYDQLPFGRYKITDPVTRNSNVVEIVENGPDIGANATKFNDDTYAVEIFKEYKVEKVEPLKSGAPFFGPLPQMAQTIPAYLPTHLG